MWLVHRKTDTPRHSRRHSRDQDLLRGDRDLLSDEQDLLSADQDLLSADKDLVRRDRDLLSGDQDLPRGDEELLLDGRASHSSDKVLLRWDIFEG